MSIYWQNAEPMESYKYNCAHCGTLMASNIGYKAVDRLGNPISYSIYICSHCEQPTYIMPNRQIPAPKIGRKVMHLPPEIHGVYSEVRDATSVGAYNAAIHLARTLLAYVAVDRGAKSKEPFAFYVDFILQERLVPANAKDWVDAIRKMGNGSAHDLVRYEKKDAERMLTFLSQLLVNVFELPKEAELQNTEA